MRSPEPARRVALIVDLAQITIVVFAAIALAFDLTGLIELPWLQDNLPELIFIAVCALIVTSALERQISLQSLEREIKQLRGQMEVVVDGLAGQVSADLLLRNRKSYTRPLEVRLENATEVVLSGISLGGVVGYYVSLFHKLARRGCHFRFLLQDPIVVGEHTSSLGYALARLGSLQKEHPGQVDIRLSAVPVRYSVLMIDPSNQSGEVQIEFYLYGEVASDRPHVDLTRAHSPQWFEFFVQDFEALWAKSQPYVSQ